MVLVFSPSSLTSVTWYDLLFCQRGDDAVHDINKDHLEASRVEELGNKATADVTTAEVNSFLLHDV